MGINKGTEEKPTTVLVSRYTYESNTQKEMTTIHKYIDSQTKQSRKKLHMQLNGSVIFGFIISS